MRAVYVRRVSQDALELKGHPCQGMGTDARPWMTMPTTTSDGLARMEGLAVRCNAYNVVRPGR